MSQVFFVLNSEPTETQQAQCGPTRKATLSDKWLMTVSSTGDADLVGPESDRLTRAEARGATNTPEWNGNGPPGGDE